MAYAITAACVDHKHLGCVRVCPVDAIHHEPQDRMVYIDPVACIDCRGCVSECPHQAIVGGPDGRPAEHARWSALNALWFTDRAAARAEVDRRVPRK